MKPLSEEKKAEAFLERDGELYHGKRRSACTEVTNVKDTNN